MDVHWRRVIVAVVGFTMAVVGFFMSITAPLIAILFPRFQAKMPALADARSQQRRYVSPPRSSQLPDNATASADSDASDATSASAESSPAEAGQRAPASSGRSPRSPVISVPETDAGSSSLQERVHHTCTPEQCANHASTSSASSSREGLTSRAKSKDGVPSTSFPKASPTSSYLKLSPRSSRELDMRLPVVSSTFTEYRGQELPALEDSPPRRSRKLFNLRRTSKQSKTSSRSGSEPASLQPSPSIPRRRSLTASPSRTLVQDNVASDQVTFESEDAPAQEKKSRRLAYLARFKSKSKEKGKEKETEKREQIGQKESLSEGERDAKHTQQHIETKERPRRKSLCLGSRQRARKTRRQDTIPAPRTHPYEAPYYFPAPNSPEAVDYVRRTRDEHMRLTSSPPPTAASFDSQPAGPRSSLSTRPFSRIPQTAPAHHVEFAPQHVKSASVDAAELGFVRPVDARVVSVQREEGGNASVVRAATLPGGSAHPRSATPRPILKLTGSH